MPQQKFLVEFINEKLNKLYSRYDYKELLSFSLLRLGNNTAKDFKYLCTWSFVLSKMDGLVHI